MPTLWCDIETYSSVDLRKSNVYRYAESDDFQILMCAYTTHPHRDPVVLIGEDEIRSVLGPLLADPEVTKVAWNAAFERVCFSRLLGYPTGTYLPPEQWRDTQILAAEIGLPHSLDKAAKAAGVDAKDSAGTRLINLFSKPNRKGGWNSPEDKPEQWKEFVEYCRQDVRVLVQLDLKLPPLTPTEHESWLVDQRINDRGVTLDLEMAYDAREAAEDNRVAHEVEMIALTGVRNPASVQQMQGWLESTGLELENLRAETVAEALDDELSPIQRRALELRQKLALTTSKKYDAALRSTNSDGRFRGAFRFHSAHTGRWSSGGIQLHNMSRTGLTKPDKALTDAENAEHEAQAVRAAILDLALGDGADDQTLKALIRSLLTGPFTVVDYSAIEARVLAWLAGETWVLEAFRAGRDIYVETAARMSKNGLELTRQQGKTAVLAAGYAGSVGAMRRMGGQGTDEELLDQVRDWRNANPSIVRLWAEIDSAMRYPHGQTVGRCKWDRIGKRTLRVTLPSGRALWYRRIRWVNEDKRDPDNIIREPSVASDQWSSMAYADPRFGTSYAWKGTIVENITQAVARDILAEALVRLDQHGYPVVAHVHDEVLVEGEDLDGVLKLMIEPPSWAKGLPIAAEGEVMERYRK